MNKTFGFALKAITASIVACTLSLLAGAAEPKPPSAEEVAKIEAAAPDKPAVKPKQPRKLLVFSRGKGHVHTSIPYSAKAIEIMGRKTDMNKGKAVHRADNDFAVSWIRQYGKGRVFYCSLGHDHPVFWTAAVLKHYCDGIQYALGDLPVDSTPR